MKGTRVYKIWEAMKRRCQNINSTAYKDYGGRGIYVCERWQDFQGFYRDMGEPPTQKHTLERIDNNGSYTPENCRWATAQEQSLNKRNNILITMDGRTMSLSQWARYLGIKRQTLRARLNRGWSHEKTLSCPLQNT